MLNMAVSEDEVPLAGEEIKSMGAEEMLPLTVVDEFSTATASKTASVVLS